MQDNEGLKERLKNFSASNNPEENKEKTNKAWGF